VTGTVLVVAFALAYFAAMVMIGITFGGALK
jgi:hypothetical protein